MKHFCDFFLTEQYFFPVYVPNCCPSFWVQNIYSDCSLHTFFCIQIPSKGKSHPQSKIILRGGMGIHIYYFARHKGCLFLAGRPKNDACQTTSLIDLLKIHFTPGTPLPKIMRKMNFFINDDYQWDNSQTTAVYELPVNDGLIILEALAPKLLCL